LLRCRACRDWPAGLQAVRAALHFKEPVPHIVHQLKYEGAFALARPLGRVLARQWRPLPQPVDLVTPIPLHEERLRQRGYNQSALLAHSLCETMEWSQQDGALQRTRHTRPQVGLDADARLRNVRNAFLVTHPGTVAGQHVLLIDDVCTTGATLVSAAEVLLEAGAATVSGYCVARAQ
jgi:ComF family protein